MRFDIGPWVLALVGVAAGVAPAAAHPGWGLVRDPVRAVVYYTDLTQVWRVDAAGRRTVAVPGVHTHELRLDRDGNLYGEHLESVGGDRWRHRVWRLAPDGALSELIPWREGFLENYGFVADERGALYWASCSVPADRCVVKRRAPNGQVSAAGSGATFARPFNFMAGDPRGGILVADGPDLRRITPADRLETVARGLSRDSGRFAIMGIWAAPDSSIYVAGFEDRVVLRLVGDRREVVARTPRPWQPSAALRGPDGLWITEYDGARVRLRRVGPAGRETIFGPGA